ncbi:Kinesin-like calmodulin-binding protein-like protein [Nymphaea thermarum]|nr:Kinesin-like calmodulin-binding protein-like protein [Nymphaea thermarum]
MTAILRSFMVLEQEKNGECSTGAEEECNRLFGQVYSRQRVRADEMTGGENSTPNPEHLSRDDARQQFLRILKILPYGNSIFFAVRKIDDPIGLLPGRIILGINKRGVHFFRPVPKEYLHSAELRDIMQFGSSNTAVFFKMRVAGVLHIFQFETKQGEEICVALQTHINDVMLRRYSKARSIASASMQGDISQSPRVPSVDAYEKRLEELTNTVEQSQRKADCSERQNLEDIMAERDKYKMLCDEKDSALQDALTMKNNVQVKFEMGLDNGSMPKNKSDVVILTDTHSCVGGIDTPSVYDMRTKLDEELKAHSKDLLAAKETTKNLTHVKVRAEPKAHLEDVLAAKEMTKKLANEKHLLEQKVLWLERKKSEEMDILEKKSVQEQEKLKLQISELEKRLSVATQELVVAQSMLTMRNNELDVLQSSLKELEELREMREDIDRKNAQTAEILKKQGVQLIELEKLYKEEQVLRKRYFNTIEG